MGGTRLHESARGTWQLALTQHGVVTRAQLLALGFSAHAIEHRLATARLHRVARGVYAVGRPDLSRCGRWMAAVLSCGPRALLSHESAAALWGFRPYRPDSIDVSVPANRVRRRPGVTVHRRAVLLPAERDSFQGIPLTTPLCTLIDIATGLSQSELERAVNEADRLDLIDPEGLREGLDELPGRRGVPGLRRMLDRRTFRLTDSELERRFLAIARSAGLPLPQTGLYVNGFKVDFAWLELDLVVETDGLRYHRTPAQQARDHLRDQAHFAAGMRPLRFTHEQIRYEQRHVEDTLRSVAEKREPDRAREAFARP